MVVSESLHVLPSNTLLGRERVSRCSVDSRGSCIRVLVVAVVATNSSASVASPHRLVHLLLRDLRLIGKCLHIVLRVITLSQPAESFLSPHANYTCESLRVVRNLYPVTEQIWLNSPIIEPVLGSSLQASNMPTISSTASHCKCWNSCTTPQDIRPM